MDGCNIMIAIMIAIAKSFHVLQDAAKQNQFTACPRRYVVTQMN